MGWEGSEKAKAYYIDYREKNKEKLLKKQREWYQKNKERLNQKAKIYAKENATRIKEYQKELYRKTRLEVLARIDPAMKCAMCGCDDTRFLEINHIKGGGNKEQKSLKKKDHNKSKNWIMLIHKDERGVEDLNLLCRICNSIDHLERVYGNTGLRVEWDKKKD